MTTPSTPRKAGPLLGNDSQTAWPFSFKVFAEGDIKVTISSAAGVETELVLDSDYTVSVNANQDTSPGGTVTYPISGDPLETDGKLVIVGDLDYDQTLNLPTGGSYSARSLENQLDRTTMQVQQVLEAVSRTFAIPVTDDQSVTLPTATSRADKLLGFDADGLPVATLPTSDSSTELRADLASTASGKGASLVGMVGGRTLQDRASDRLNVADRGAVYDGATISTSALQSALDSGASVIEISGPIKHGPVTVTRSVHIVYSNDATVTPALDTGTTQSLFLVSAPGVVIEDFRLSAYAATNSANKYLIRATAGADDLQILRPKISGVTASDGNLGLTNLIVTHAIYAENVANLRVWGGDIGGVSGAAVFMKNVSGYSLIGNKVNNTGWYSINADHDCFDGVIAYNYVGGDSVNARYWGGSVNLQSNTAGGKNKRCKIIGNNFSGVHNYGSVVRVQSSEDVEMALNTFDGCTDGSLLAGPLQYVSIARRGTAEGAPENGPCINVFVKDNIMTAGLGAHWAVYIQNQYLATASPHENIVVDGNISRSVDASRSFSVFCAVHGFKSGVKGLKVSNNIASVFTASGSPGGAAIGLLSTQASGVIEDFEIIGNQLTDLNTGSPNQSYQIGVFTQATTKNGTVRVNTFKNFRYGYRQAAGLENIRGGNDNTFIDCLDDTLYSGLPVGGGFDMSIGTVLPVTGVYRTGHIRQNPSAAASASFGWMVTTAGGAMTAAWASGQTYTAGTWYRNASGRVYELITAGGGTTATEPTGTTVGTDETAGDGYTWRCRSTTSARWATLPVLGAVAALP